MADPVIRFRDVSKVFRRANGRGDLLAVDKLSFEVAPGEIVAVLGKTGCGKSTMFNLIAGLIEPTSGEVAVSGHNPFRDFEAFRGKIGIVFQGDRLMPWRTALANVLLGLEILDTDPEAGADGGARVAGTARARGYMRTTIRMRSPAACASGFRSRARSRSNPQLLLCDEPFSALDEMTARDLRAEFVRLVRQNGKTAVFITHQISEADGDRRPASWSATVPRASPLRPHGSRRRLAGTRHRDSREDSCEVLALEARGRRW